MRSAIDAGIKFAQHLPGAPDSAGVLTRAAEDEFAAKDLPRASELSKMLLARQPPVDAGKQRIAWTIIAESQFSAGAYDQAEAAFYEGARALRQPMPSREATSPSVWRPMSTSRARRSSRPAMRAGAVEDYLRVAKVAPDSKIRATAEYDAADAAHQFEAMGSGRSACSRDSGATSPRASCPRK